MTNILNFEHIKSKIDLLFIETTAGRKDYIHAAVLEGVKASENYDWHLKRDDERQAAAAQQPVADVGTVAISALTEVSPVTMEQPAAQVMETKPLEAATYTPYDNVTHVDFARQQVEAANGVGADGYFFEHPRENFSNIAPEVDTIGTAFDDIGWQQDVAA